MNSRYLLILSISSLLAIANSCKKAHEPDPCAPVAVLITQVQSPGNVLCNLPSLPTGLQEEHAVINSDAEMQAAFGCGVSAFDFKQYTLLIGIQTIATNMTVESQQVLQTCKGYTYSVKLRSIPGSFYTPIVYHALIPKLPANAQVSFDVQLLK